LKSALEDFSDEKHRNRGSNIRARLLSLDPSISKVIGEPKGGIQLGTKQDDAFVEQVCSWILQDIR
jgi:hypothetical protein